MNFVFDLYGTLIDIWTDESRAELWSGVAELLGEPVGRAPEVREEYLSLCKKMHRGGYHELDLSLVFEEMLSSRGIHPSTLPHMAREFRRLSMVRLRCFRGVKGMLREIKKARCGVFLLSNAQSCFTLDELSSLGLINLFDGIVISSDVGVKKPSAEVFDIAFKKFGISAENSIYVGNDMRDDVLGASSVGMPTAYVHTAQSGSYPDLQIPEPTYTVGNHRELKRLLISLALDKNGAR